jgi:hypothetical protein
MLLYQQSVFSSILQTICLPGNRIMAILHKSQKTLQIRQFYFFVPTEVDAIHYVGRIYVRLALQPPVGFPGKPIVDYAYHIHVAYNQYWVWAIQGETSDALADCERGRQAVSRARSRGIGVADVMKKG